MAKENDSKVLDGYRRLQAQGFNASKIFVNGPAQTANVGIDEFFSGRIEDELENIHVVRDAVGGHFDIILEAHWWIKKPEAIAFCTEVSKHRPMVLEDL